MYKKKGEPGNHSGRDHLRDRGLDGRTIFILLKFVLNFINLGYSHKAALYLQDYERLRFLEREIFAHVY